MWVSSRAQAQSHKKILCQQQVLDFDFVRPKGQARRLNSANKQVINGVPNVDYRHLKAVGFALLEASLGNK